MGAKGKGRRGGARAIYFYHDADMPLFLLAIYAKAARADLKPDEKRRLAALTEALCAEYGR